MGQGEWAWLRREVKQGIGIITLAAPGQLNAIHAPMMAELLSALEATRDDPAIRAVVLTGEGRAFCSGAHLGEMLAFDDRGAAVYGVLDDGWNRAVRLIRGMKKPVITAVNGIAAGGGVGLALAADIVLAARSARFIQVFGPRLGVIPDVGSTWFLPQMLGRARALSLMLTGAPLEARQAADWGLIAGCVDDDDLEMQALALAGQLAAGPIEAFAEIRAAVDRAMVSGLDAALDHERDTNGRLCGGPDFGEGIAAFVGKREPDFVRANSKASRA